MGGEADRKIGPNGTLMFVAATDVQPLPAIRAALLESKKRSSPDFKAVLRATAG